MPAVNMAHPMAFIRNPATDVRVVEADAKGARRIVACAWSAMQGFTETALDRDGQPAFTAALDLAAGRDAVLDRLSPAMALALWRMSLIILPPEKPPAFAPDRFTAAADVFAAERFILLHGCLAPAMVGILAAHYGAQLDNGTARLSTGSVDRWSLHNDPAGRVVLRALLPAVAALVGVPVKPSYSYASLYREGAVLPVHTDRPQCEYTLSVLIDHQPMPADGVSPWALRIHAGPDTEPVDCFPRLGGGILFCGRKLPHGRKPLPATETCWTLLLHYVDADFAGPLD